MPERDVDVSDPLRVLLTETLPYEIPFPFTNFHFHDILMKQKNDLPQILSNWLFSKNNSRKVYIPYNFEIRYSGTKRRTLSIVHPAAQIMMCDFYEKHSRLITESCRKSRYSIRKPLKTADLRYEKDLANNPTAPGIQEKIVETETPPYGLQQRHVSSFFSYSEYNFLHKFFDSFEFINLEKRFLYFQTLDISKCFYNIYTHSISWSVKSKEYAKRNIGKMSFENGFDKLMQKLNHNETSGIVVGPEFSRIFAEIILQGVDQRIDKELSEAGRNFGTDYSIRRYVDDYFIFTNDLGLQEEIRATIIAKLEKFKLYLNDHKTETTSRPFVSVKARSKLDVSESLEAYYRSLYRGAPSGLCFHSGWMTANATRKIIRRLASIAKGDPDGWQSICRYGITTVINKNGVLLQKLIASGEQAKLDDPRTFSFVRNNLELLFYLYAMDSNVRTTLLLARYILFLTRFFAPAKELTQSGIRQYIFELSTKHLQVESSMSPKLTEFSIEVSTLLIVLQDLGDEYLIPPSLLARVLQLRESDEQPGTYEVRELSYFQAVSGLYYARDHPEYDQIRSALEDGIDGKFQVDPFDVNSAEHLLFLMDMSSCPWLSKDTKRRIIRRALKGAAVGKQKILAEAGKLLRFLEKRIWFFDWISAEHLGTILLKKELSTPY